MTISTTTSRALYAGNGVTTIFSFPYLFLANGDLEVRLIEASGASTILTLTTDYTVTGANNDAGGSVTMIVAPALGEQLLIRRIVDLTQETTYPSGDPFPAETHERALDKLTMMVQQHDEEFARTLQLPPESDVDASTINVEAVEVVAGIAADVSAVAAIDDAVVIAVDNIAAILAAPAQAAAAAASALAADASADAAAASAGSIALPLPISSGGTGGGQVAGFRNIIINGNFAVNQRVYVSGAATGGANQYTLDRWRVVTSGQNLTFSTSANGRVATAPAGGIEQVIEGANIVGGIYVINWAGTATCTVDGVAKAKGATFTLTAGTNATVRFSSGTVELVQVELGAQTSTFEQRTLPAEVTLCGWYFRLWEVGYSDPIATSSTRYGFTQYPEMRTTPTVVNLAAIGTQANVSSVAFSDVTPRGLRLDITPSGSATVLCRRAISLSAEL